MSFVWSNLRTSVFNSERYTVNTDTLTIRGVTQSDQSQFWCIHGAQASAAVHVTVMDLPRATVRVTPDTSVFTGETVTLKCEIETHHKNWRYLWYKDRTVNPVFSSESNIFTISSASDQDEFWCRGERAGRPSSSQDSDHVTLSFKNLPKVTVRVTPDRSVFTGETVTLKCEIEEFNRLLHWRYQWSNRKGKVLNSDRYPVKTNSLTIKATQSEEFCCETHINGRPKTSSSSYIYLTVKDLPRATVRVTPDTSVFTGETVTLKYSNIFTISSASDQDEFWCRGERAGRPSSSQDSGHVTLSVKGSKPKAELTSDTEGSVLTGNTVTLTCLMNQFTGWKFYWYKHTQNTENTTTAEIYFRIHNITVSDGGQYWCRAGRGNPVYYTDYSDVLWINVTASSSSSHGLKVGVAVGLSVMFLIIFLVLLWCYKTKKGKVSESPSGVSPQQNISQISDQKHNEDDGYTSLQSDNVSGAADLTYADIELKPKKEVKKNKEKKDISFGSNDVTYAQIK